VALEPPAEVGALEPEEQPAQVDCQQVQGYLWLRSQTGQLPEQT